MSDARSDPRGDAVTLDIGGTPVTVSHPGKVFFGQRGETKLDLIRYYQAIERPLLTALRGRPLLLERYPEGAGGKSFFQKRVPKAAPPWLVTAEVSTPNGTTSDALVAADLAHIIWAVNLGCIGLHLWPHRADDPAHADELRIDLDPQPGTGFEDIRVVAGLTRDLLDELGMTGYPKTTGNRGLHVYVRLLPHWDSFEVRFGKRFRLGAAPSGNHCRMWLVGIL